MSSSVSASRCSPSDELRELLALGAHWFEASGGVFNPSVGVLTERWKRAESDQRERPPDELAAS